MDQHVLVENIVRVAKMGKAHGLPIVLPTVNVKTGVNKPTIPELQEGYEVYPVVDAVGGTSIEAHRAGLERIVQAGGHPTCWVQLICEFQRDWNRKETVKAFRDILFDPRVPFVAAERSAKTV